MVQETNYGDIFTVEDGKIIVNKSCLLGISWSPYMQADSTSYSNNVVNAYLYVNNNQCLRDITQHNALIGTYHTIDISPNILKVNAGDKIALSVMSQTIPVKVINGSSVSRIIAHVVRLL